MRAGLPRAVDARQALRIHYYTAGRNLLTERQIEPYWLEERHDSLYLRAYCHEAGRVLIFGVDRIQSVAVVGDACCVASCGHVAYTTTYAWRRCSSAWPNTVTFARQLSQSG